MKIDSAKWITRRPTAPGSYQQTAVEYKSALQQKANSYNSTTWKYALEIEKKKNPKNKSKQRVNCETVFGRWGIAVAANHHHHNHHYRHRHRHRHRSRHQPYPLPSQQPTVCK